MERGWIFPFNSFQFVFQFAMTYGNGTFRSPSSNHRKLQIRIWQTCMFSQNFSFRHFFHILLHFIHYISQFFLCWCHHIMLYVWNLVPFYSPHVKIGSLSFPNTNDFQMDIFNHPIRGEYFRMHKMCSVFGVYAIYSCQRQGVCSLFMVNVDRLPFQYRWAWVDEVRVCEKL